MFTAKTISNVMDGLANNINNNIIHSAVSSSRYIP